MIVGCTFEAGLGVLAIAIGWLFDADPSRLLVLDWAAAGWGLLAACPMLVLFGLLLLAPRVEKCCSEP